MSAKRFFILILCFFELFSLTSCGSERKAIEPADGWYATWSAMPEVAELAQVPTNPSLRGNTCRQQIRTSIGGDKIRLTFSNEEGESPVTLEAVHVAKLESAGGASINALTDTAVTFGGSAYVTIPAGKTVTSDEIAFSFGPLEYLAVTTKFSDKVPAYPTCHRNSNSATFVIEGDHVSDETFAEVSIMSSNYFLSRVDTWAKAGTKTLVCYGDFISDNRSFNSFDSWSETLAKLLLQDGSAAGNVSVVNLSYNDNSVQRAWENIEDEVLSVPGIHDVILLLGSNDISVSQSDTSGSIVEKYKKIVDICHKKGVSVYAGTLPPFEGNTVFYSELHEKIRLAVNDYIKSPDSCFDGYIDFADMLCYAEKPSKMQSIYDSGDSMTPNSAGQEAMAKAANEVIIEAFMTVENKK